MGVKEMPLTEEDIMFEHEKAVMGLFIDNAKTYTQLSTGALVFTITFVDKVVGSKNPFQLDWFLISSWIGFIIAIGAGALYQYLAVHFIQNKSRITRSHGIPMPDCLINHPWPLYGVMMVCFFGGAVIFMIGAITRL
jgi:hypothetical protein